ncbi:MAG: DUF1315 family protein [Luminiphilus sp.]|nr:DUF1315 family protein [Luminiphilus sp.]
MATDYLQSIQQMDRGLYDRLLESLATGRWPDGRPVTEAQRQHAMQAVITWGELHLPSDERVGFIDKGSKAGEDCDAPAPLKWETQRGGVDS